MINGTLRKWLLVSTFLLASDAIAQLTLISITTSTIVRPKSPIGGERGLDLTQNVLSLAAAALALAVSILSILVAKYIRIELWPSQRRKIRTWVVCTAVSTLFTIVATGITQSSYGNYSLTNPEYWAVYSLRRSNNAGSRQFVQLCSAWRYNGIALSIFGVFLTIVGLAYLNAAAGEELVRPRYRAAKPTYTQITPGARVRNPDMPVGAVRVEYAIKQEQ